MEILFVMLFGGGFFGGGVMGLPPGERDAKLAQCAPQDVIFYTEWAARGQGQAGAKGIDGLAADPEILAFIAAIDKSIQESIAQNAREGEEKILGENIPPLVKIILNRSGCMYLDVDAKSALKLMANPPQLPEFTPNWVGMLPALQATFIVNGGDQADAMAKHIEALMGLLPEGDRAQGLKRKKFPIPLEGASLVLHRHENYFILGWGEATIDAAVKGLKDESQGLKGNERFQAAMEKVILERPSSVAWFDMKSLVNKAVQGLGPQGLVVAAVVQQLGADTIESFAMCSGVVEGQLHTKGFVKTGGKTEGILALAAGRPLTAKDFEAVPGDADLLLAFTIDLPKILGTTRKLIAQAGEQPKENFEAVLAQLEKELGISFENDLFKAFGQTWVLFDSPSSGGVLFTAPVLGLEVTDYEAAKVTFGKLMEVLKLAVPGEIRVGRGVYLQKKTFLDHEVYYINAVGREEPFAPAFTLTKTHLLVSPHPQPLKAHLRFLASQEARFSEKFEEKIQHGGGELFAMCHTEPQLFARFLVAVSPMISSLTFPEIQREGFNIDGFEFPSARAFLPYIGNGLMTTERTENGILFNSRHGLPVPGLSAMVTVLPVFGFWNFARIEMRAAPAAAPIQINQHVPMPPAERLREKRPLRLTAS